jgi:hypothetical protein
VPGTISAILIKLKEMLGKRQSNDQMATEIGRLAKLSNLKTDDAVCPVV